MSYLIADYVCRTDVLGTTRIPMGKKTSHARQFENSGELNMSVDDLIDKLVIAINLLSSHDIRRLIGYVKPILIEKSEKLAPCK